MIVPFDESWRAGVAQLWRDSFGDEAAPPFATWGWQYDGNPDAKTPPVLLFIDPPTVIGMIGTIPVALETPDGALEASWGIDVLVHPDFRAAGVGGYLIREWDASTEASLSLGVTPAAKEVFLASGRTYVGEVPLFKRVLRPDVLLAQRLGSRVAGHALGGAARMWLWARAARRPKDLALKWRPITDIDERFDALWSEAVATHGLAARRGAAELRWRFGPDAPGRFEVHGAFDGDRLVGFAATTLLHRDGITSGCIADIVCRDDANIRNFTIHSALDSFRSAGAHIVECLASHPAYRQALQQSGFVERPSPTSLLYRVSHPDRQHAFAQGSVMSGWHITYADSDCLTVAQRELAHSRPDPA